MNTLTERVLEYIAARRDGKTPPATATADVVAEHVQKYQPANWLDEASAGVRKFNMKFVTHAAKFTHGDSKTTSVFDVQTAPAPFPVLSSLDDDLKELDMTGTAAGQGYMRLLMLRDDAGRTLIQLLAAGDTSALEPLAKDEEQLQRWLADFMSALEPLPLKSDKYGKEIYFPVGDSYHLIAPLFPTSFYHLLNGAMAGMRFPEGFRDANKARSEGKFHPLPIVTFPRIGGFEVCASNPQTRTYLNSKRGGMVNLLPCMPPVWRSNTLKLDSHGAILSHSVFLRESRRSVLELRDFLLGTDHNNVHIRRGVVRRVNNIIDELVSFTAITYTPDWSADWPEELAASFGRWLARTLRMQSKNKLNAQKAEADFFTRLCLPELEGLAEVVA